MYPTSQLYSDCDVLSVRQLFIQHLIIKQHRIIPTTNLNNQRRKYNIYNIKKCKTVFAKKHFNFLGAYLYNKINKSLPLQQITPTECKKKLKQYLTGLDYKQTESLLHIQSWPRKLKRKLSGQMNIQLNHIHILIYTLTHT